MLIIGSSDNDIACLKSKLKVRFDIEDLGATSYFLGVRIICNKQNKTISLY